MTCCGDFRDATDKALVCLFVCHGDVTCSESDDVWRSCANNNYIDMLLRIPTQAVVNSVIFVKGN